MQEVDPIESEPEPVEGDPVPCPEDEEFFVRPDAGDMEEGQLTNFWICQLPSPAQPARQDRRKGQVEF